MARILKMKTSCHGQMCFEETDFTEKEHAVLRRIMGNKWMASEDYKAKARGASPFFQGGGDLEKGWALIEFWSHDALACQDFINYVNRELERV